MRIVLYAIAGFLYWMKSISDSSKKHIETVGFDCGKIEIDIREKYKKFDKEIQNFPEEIQKQIKVVQEMQIVEEFNSKTGNPPTITVEEEIELYCQLGRLNREYVEYFKQYLI